MPDPEDIRSLLEVYQRADGTTRSNRNQRTIKLTDKGMTALKILKLLHQQIHQSQAGVEIRVTQSGIIDYALRQQLELMLKKIREEQERG